MIVIGRRGKRGLARDLIGDATAKVIGHASCPVLVCPRSAQLGDGPLLTATDGSRHGDAVAWYADKLATRLNRELIVVSAVLPDQTDTRRREAVSAIERIEAAFQDGQPKVKGIDASGRAHEVIIVTMRQHDASMVVIGSHGRTGIEQLLLGSVAERVIGFADRPVLVVR